MIPTLSGFMSNLYSNLFGQANINAIEEVAEAGKWGGAGLKESYIYSLFKKCW